MASPSGLRTLCDAPTPAFSAAHSSRYTDYASSDTPPWSKAGTAISPIQPTAWHHSTHTQQGNHPTIDTKKPSYRLTPRPPRRPERAAHGTTTQAPQLAPRGRDWLQRRPGYGMIGTERADSVGPTTKHAGTHDAARPGRKEDS